LKSEFLAAGSGLGFHVAACNLGVFFPQYSSVSGKPTFSTQSAESGLSRTAVLDHHEFQLISILLLLGQKAIYSKSINPSLSDLVAENTLERFRQKTHTISL